MLQITDTHPTYDLMKPIWQLCADAIGGQQVIHAKGETYLPKLHLQTPEQYAGYKQRARWLPAADLTMKAYVGLVTRKAPSLSGSSVMLEFFKNVDKSKTDVDQYMENVLKHLISSGRCATLLDYTSTNPEKTLGDIAASGDQVVWAFYDTFSILDWRYNNGRLVYCLLKESSLDTESTSELITYRALRLVDGVYEQTLSVEKKGEVIEGAPIRPQIKGKYFTEIPLVFHTNSLSGNIVENPPILDVANLNISHYMLMADLQHALHYVSLPTAYMIGVNKNDDIPRTIGSSMAWIIPNHQAKVGMLEYTGAGVANIALELASIQEDIAASGARVLNSEVENTATASKLNSMSESSLLATLVSGLNSDAKTMIALTQQWLNDSKEAEVVLNTDFLPERIEPQALQAYVAAWVQGAISHEQLFKLMKKGELIDGDTDYQEHLQQLENEGFDSTTVLDRTDFKNSDAGIEDA